MPLAIPELRMIGGGDVVTVSERFLVPVPIAFVALRVTVKTPVALGVPLMRPVFMSTLKPFGSGDALKVVGDFVAAI